MERSVIMVEDQDGWGALLEIAFAGLPQLRVVHFSSGEEAWNQLQLEKTAALITDLQMPGMDGFELIEHVRADRRFVGLPIIVISGCADAGLSARLRRMGASAFFPKPYSPSAVRNKLEELLHENESQT